MKNWWLIFLCWFNCLPVCAQDLFEDARGNGVPVVSRGNLPLASARVNSGDNSLKVNFFNWTNAAWEGTRTNGTRRTDWEALNTKDGSDAAPGSRQPDILRLGWGVGLKAKAENGIGKLFGSGRLVPGVEFNGYLASRTTRGYTIPRPASNDLLHYKTFGYWLLSGNGSASQYRFYYPDSVIGKQLGSFQNHTGFRVGIAHYFISPLAKRKDLSSNTIKCFSLTLSRVNNYATLPKVEIKDSRTSVYSSNDTMRTVTLLDEEGATYAIEDMTNTFNTFLEANLRGYFAILPKPPLERVAFVLYPGIRYSTQKAKVDLGFATHFLKKGNPTVSELGIYLELNDVFNAASSQDPFLSRSVTIGLTAAYNVLFGQVNN
jgi:hypothetical protein